MDKTGRWRTPRFLLLVLCLVTTSVGLSYALGRSTAAGARSWKITTTSPTGAYSLTLTGRNDPPPLGDYQTGFHSAGYSVAKSGREFIPTEGLYRGGSYDAYFLNQYPVQEWVGDSAIRFGPPRELPDDQCDEVTVQNESGQTLKFVRLDAARVEKYLIFDLAPGAKVKLVTYPQTRDLSDFSGFTCYATVVSDGRELEGGGAFKPLPRLRRAGHFVIKVSENAIDINSWDFRLMASR
jgi:hypothetical protein